MEPLLVADRGSRIIELVGGRLAEETAEFEFCTFASTPCGRRGGSPRLPHGIRIQN
jgi:hypothetical protein